MGRAKNINIKKANVQSEYSLDEIQELKRCISDPVYFIRHYVKIQHPVRGIIPFDMYQYQERMLKTYQDNRFVVVLSARQTGKSISAAAYLLWYAIFHFDKTILIASNKNSNAMEMIHRIKIAYENLPTWLKPGVLEDGWNKHSVGFDNGSRIVSEATSENSGRGMSISLLYLDEFAFVPEAIQVEFWSSISPTLSTGGSCIMTSTPNGDLNIFAQIWQGAQVKANGFAAVRVYWDEPPGRDEKFKQEEIGRIGERLWSQEYECEFLSSDALLIDSVFLNILTQEMKSFAPITNLYGVDFWDYIHKGRTYLVGVDPATGSGQDFSVITAFEFPSMVQVAEYRSNTTSTNDLYQVLKNLLLLMESREAIVHFSVENNGVGEGVISLFEADDNGPENANFVSEIGKARRGMTTVSRTKMKACVNFKEMLERRKLMIKSQTLLAELKAFARKRGAYAAQPGSTDDCVSASLIVIRLVEEISSYEQEAFDKLYNSQEFEQWSEYVNEFNAPSEVSDDDQPLPIAI